MVIFKESKRLGRKNYSFYFCARNQ